MGRHSAQDDDDSAGVLGGVDVLFGAQPDTDDTAVTDTDDTVVTDIDDTVVTGRHAWRVDDLPAPSGANAVTGEIVAVDHPVAPAAGAADVPAPDRPRRRLGRKPRPGTTSAPMSQPVETVRVPQPGMTVAEAIAEGAVAPAEDVPAAPPEVQTIKMSPVADPVAAPITPPAADPIADPVTDPTTDPTADPDTDSVAEPVADRATGQIATMPAPDPSSAAEHDGMLHRGARASAADLALLRADSALRWRCVAAFLLPYVVYVVVLLVIGAAGRTFAIWIWAPTILACVSAGSLLDLAHKRAGTAAPTT